MTITTTVTEGIVDMIPPGSAEIAINASSRIQVLDQAGDVANARKAQGAAFVRREKCLVIWSDEAEPLLDDAQLLHQQLTRFLWDVATPGPSASGSYFTLASPGGHSRMSSSVGQTPGTQSICGGMSDSASQRSAALNSSRGQLVLHQEKAGDEEGVEREKEDVEKNMEEGYEERPTMVISAIIHGLACALAMLISILHVKQALVFSFLDSQWLRLATAVLSPIYFTVVMFLCDNIFSIIFMLFGPVRQLSINSRYHSGVKPKPLRGALALKKLPHITIQMPVYKESLEFVLKPSFESIKKAIRTYELQGGSASIIVSEDGMVLVDETERQARLDYYEENNITWVGRPKHVQAKDDPEGRNFNRAGRFKKASNLNFTYDVLLNAERMVEERRNPETGAFNDGQTEGQVYNACIQEFLATIHPDACGSGTDRFGDFVLMVDSDTRIPRDCFFDAATEMTRSADVGILQHCSGVMMVSTSFFERCIGFFTRLVNFSISFAVANGDVAPFMGHNAYLRWSAMREIARTIKSAEGRDQVVIWSEEHVSEDFVMALDMIERGYITRWATYANSEYMEGVSLSADDELNRWQKYAWGVSEMVFNPFKRWYRGPFTKLFRRFMWGNAPIHYKWSSCSYCFSYYAIALAFPMTIALTLIGGWFGWAGDMPIIAPFKVFLSTIVVFTLGGTISLAIVRFRAGMGGLLPLVWENLKFLPFLVIFFGGLSYHVSTALLSHVLGINMTWGATLKDIEMSNFFVELPLILKRHYRLFILCIGFLGGLAVLSLDLLPLIWRIEGFITLFPACLIYTSHLLYPFLLNPNLVRFSF